MKTPEEWMNQIGHFSSENFNVESAMKGDFSLHPCEVSVLSKEDIAEIQLDALTQGRKEGREQGIREVLSLHHALCDKDIEDDFIWHDDDVCSKSILALLTHPSPKEQEK